MPECGTRRSWLLVALLIACTRTAPVVPAATPEIATPSLPAALVDRCAGPGPAEYPGSTKAPLLSIAGLNKAKPASGEFDVVGRVAKRPPRDVLLFMAKPSQLIRGGTYRFSLKVCGRNSTGKPLNDMAVLGFEDALER